VHAKKELSDCAGSLILDPSKANYSQISIKLFLAQVRHLDFTDFGNCFGFSGLYCAPFLGIVEVVATPIQEGYSDINEGDSSHYILPAWAAHNRHKKVVEILLRQKDVSANKPDYKGLTLLTYAAWNGPEGVVKLET